MCIEVDNATYSTANWTDIDPASTFVNNQAECSTLTNQEFEQVDFSVYPNPVNNILNVSVQKEASFKLITINGQVNKQGQLQTGENTLNVSNLSNGLYFLQVKTPKSISTKKIIKQ